MCARVCKGVRASLCVRVLCVHRWRGVCECSECACVWTRSVRISVRAGVYEVTSVQVCAGVFTVFTRVCEPVPPCPPHSLQVPGPGRVTSSRSGTKAPLDKHV